jgi:hypothetical protein
MRAHRCGSPSFGGVRWRCCALVGRAQRRTGSPRPRTDGRCQPDRDDRSGRAAGSGTRRARPRAQRLFHGAYGAVEDRRDLVDGKVSRYMSTRTRGRRAGRPAASPGLRPGRGRALARPAGRAPVGHVVVGQRVGGTAGPATNPVQAGISRRCGAARSSRRPPRGNPGPGRAPVRAEVGSWARGAQRRDEGRPARRRRFSRSPRVRRPRPRAGHGCRRTTSPKASGSPAAWAASRSASERVSAEQWVTSSLSAPAPRCGHVQRQRRTPLSDYCLIDGLGAAV